MLGSRPGPSRRMPPWVLNAPHRPGGGHYYFVVNRDPLPPDFDQFLAWVEGTMASSPLSEAEQARIREIERIRLEVQRDSTRATAGFATGPVVGPCSACHKPLQLGWRYCPFCGAASTATCPRCNFPLPQEEGVQFCPQCGGRAQ